MGLCAGAGARSFINVNEGSHIQNQRSRKSDLFKHLVCAELDADIAEDPFHKHGLARYEIVEFDAVKYHPAIAHMA